MLFSVHVSNCVLVRIFQIRGPRLLRYAPLLVTGDETLDLGQRRSSRAARRPDVTGSRALTVIIQHEDTDTAAFTFWLYRCACASVFKSSRSVLGCFGHRTPCVLVQPLAQTFWGSERPRHRPKRYKHYKTVPKRPKSFKTPFD